MKWARRSSYSWVPTVSMTSVASMQPTWAARSRRDAPGETGQEAGAEGVADAGRVGLALLLGAADLDRVLAGPLDAHAAARRGW